MSIHLVWIHRNAARVYFCENQFSKGCTGIVLAGQQMLTPRIPKYQYAQLANFVGSIALQFQRDISAQ